MSDKTLTKDKIAAAIQNAPAVEGVLKKLADKVARGVRLPASFTARGLDYAAQRELEHLLGTIGQRQPDGSFYIQLHEFLRGPEMWREAMECFGLVRGRDEGVDDEDVFARLKLIVPDGDWYVDRMAASEEIRRFVAKPERRREWLTFAKCALDRFLTAPRPITTLSQLGSDWFSDSKKLRSGPWRRQLVAIYEAILNYSSEDERKFLEEFGIADNPYTSCVTFCAPLVFWIGNEEFDFPKKLYDKRMACQLPLETVLAISQIGWCGTVKELTTSENASPFLDLVKAGVPCVYTEGYPNMAVSCMLKRLSRFNLRCTHDGDADLDGFRIAQMVSDCIRVSYSRPVKALYWAQRSKTPVGIPLSDEQRKRAEAFLAKDPNGHIAAEVREMLAWGRWIEQESFDSIEGLSMRGSAR